LAYGTTNFTPAVPVNLGANANLTTNYYVAARFDDTNLIGGCESSLTNITIVWEICGNLDIVSQSSAATNIILQWNGTNVLQSTTNLGVPNWQNVWTGSTAVVNMFTNSIQTPPMDFFRLSPGD
jgi:hypothetical protein